MNNFKVARLLFTSPGQAFTELKQHPVFGLPMLLTLLGVMVVTGWYYAKVDLAWLQDQMTASAHLTTEQQQRLAAGMSRPVLLWSSVIAAPIVTTIIITIGALYFTLAGNVANVRHSFTQWFAFNWWAASPQILALIPSLLILALSSTNQIHVSALQPLSLNELVFHRPMGAPGYSLLSALGLVQVATAAMTYVGIRAWSGRSALFCLVFALLPAVLIYGVWALFAFR